MMLSFQS